MHKIMYLHFLLLTIQQKTPTTPLKNRFFYVFNIFCNFKPQLINK